MLNTEVEKQVNEIKARFTGKRIQIAGDHPHAGEYGVVECFEFTLAGFGAKVKLDDSVDGCYVFKAHQMILQQPEGWAGE